MDCPSITVLVFKYPFFYLIIGPKRKSSDAGESDMPKRSHKVKVLDLIRKRKKIIC